MNRLVWLILVAIGGCAPAIAAPTTATVASQSPPVEKVVPPFDAQAARGAIKAWHLVRTPDPPLQRVVAFPVPGSADLTVAICDTDPQWWGYFGVFALQNGKVRWQAKCQDEPIEQSVRWVRGVELPGFSGPIIEVFGMTHMGNGSLYLYELRDRELVLILQTHAVDCHSGDQEVIQNDRFSVMYSDANKDGVSDVLLTGIIDELSDGQEEVIASRSCQKAFLWDSKSGRFEPDPSRTHCREGD